MGCTDGRRAGVGLAAFEADVGGGVDGVRRAGALPGAGVEPESDMPSFSLTMSHPVRENRRITPMPTGQLACLMLLTPSCLVTIEAVKMITDNAARRDAKAPRSPLDSPKT